ncbi:PBP1A family penicillin-binding protein [Bryobacter aggregatus]|uniref:PBP1A family penicillin-binding protein n=1 Tax=Bryobacter aggregatus TaxID=360054 RepID=UPI001EE15C9F|nr:PBP1A family penicillin-binding protein [Bryobacter aggregatus]
MRILLHPVGRIVLASLAFIFIGGLLFFGFLYNKYSREIDEKLAAGPFRNASRIYAAPHVLALGDPLDREELVGQLRRSGYSDSSGNPVGHYVLRGDSIEIYPGPDSFFARDGGLVRIADGKISQIVSLVDNSVRNQYQLEPELVTNIFDRSRQKRRMVRYEDLPKTLVNAVTSVEDKRFFKHSGFDPIRIVKALMVDISTGRHAEGASTLSQQLARGFFLTPEKTWRRKINEALYTLILEQKLTKEQIFEYYANYVPLGWRGGFNIFGFGEAAQAYLGKDVRDVTLPEAALLAGLIQRPSATNPFVYPEKAKTRRNIVLRLMRDNDYIDERLYAPATATEVRTVRGNGDSADSSYFVDLVNDTLTQKFPSIDFQDGGYRVFTSLDVDLQRDAADAVRAGLKEVDEAIARRHKNDKDGKPATVQVALVALDPRNGEIKALVGGRNYGLSQLNRAMAKRQPGSIFKPLVYAAALNTALFDSEKVFTPTTMLVDEPTTFYYDGRSYDPGNYQEKYYGAVSLRTALMKSLNIPTIKLAEAVGYGEVVKLARRAGLNMEVRATPSVALGAYEVTPIEMAGAYTMFPTNGIASRPSWVRTIRDRFGGNIFEQKVERHEVLDPRIDYIMVNLMEDVLRAGTGAGVRTRGFTLPAGGKTGSSRDGWFAGFTSKLVCVVWVGFDDNRDIKLTGGQTALPIWTEFMKRAHTHREYRNVHGFEAPQGVVSAEVDVATGKLGAGRTEYYVAGTQPVEGVSGQTQVFGWDLEEPKAGVSSHPSSAGGEGQVSSGGRSVTIRKKDGETARSAEGDAGRRAKPGEEGSQDKKSIWGKIRSIFK